MRRDGGKAEGKGETGRVKRERVADTNLCWPPATLRDKLHWWTIFPTLPLIHYSSLLDNNKWMAAVGNLCSTKCVNMAPTIHWPIPLSIAMHWAKIHHNVLHFTHCNPHRQSLTATEKWIFHNDPVMRQIFLECKHNMLLICISSFCSGVSHWLQLINIVFLLFFFNQMSDQRNHYSVEYLFG